VVLQSVDVADESGQLDPFLVENSSGNGVTSENSIPPQLFQPNPVFDENRKRSRIGTGDVIIRNFMMLNESGHQVTSCDYDEKLTLCYLLELCRSVTSDFILGVRLRDLKGNFVYSANDINSIHRIEGAAGDRLVVSTDLRFPLAHQDYVVLTGIFGFCDGVALVEGIYDYSRSVIWDVIEDAAYLRVHPCKIMPMAGPVNACFSLKIAKLKSHHDPRFN
jgi:hypothetical protein